MNKIVLTLAAFGLTATAAFAQTPTDFASVDVDASGELSFEELLVAWPDLTQDEFTAADVDLSASLSATELSALQPAAPNTSSVAPETLPAPLAAPAVDLGANVGVDVGADAGGAAGAGASTSLVE